MDGSIDRQMGTTLYEILEVIPTASQETIHAAYRSLISRFHPDKVAGLGPELEAAADARTKEINHAYDILGDMARRARYDQQLRRDDGSRPFATHPGLAQPASATPSRTAAPLAIEAPQKRPAVAMLAAAAVGITLVLTLPQAANLVFSAVEFSLTGHARFFYEADNPVDIKGGALNATYLLVVWGWLFANFLYGLLSYRSAVFAGETVAARSGGSFASSNDRLFLFLTFVCVIAIGELFFSAHTMGNVLADMFLLAGAYLAERGIG
jgi:DnaJ domain